MRSVAGRKMSKVGLIIFVLFHSFVGGEDTAPPSPAPPPEPPSDDDAPTTSVPVSAPTQMPIPSPTVSESPTIVTELMEFDYSYADYATISTNTYVEVSDSSTLSASISSAFYTAAAEDGIDLDDTSVLATVKAAINNFYGTIFGTNSYSTSIEPNVDAATTFTAVVESLENIFREPLDFYAAYNDAADAPGIDSSGGLFCGGFNTKTHLFPGTTGLSEIGALRDCLSETLALTNEPSVESLVSSSMSSVLLPVDSDGNNYLFSDLSSMSIEYTFIASTTSATFPALSFYTGGAVTGDGTYNWQDIKGCEVEFKVSVDGSGSFDVGDTVTLTMSDDGDAFATTTGSASLVVTLKTLYVDDSGDTNEEVSSLTALKALQPPVVDGGVLGDSQMAVFPIIVGDGGGSLLVTEFSMVMGNVNHLFSSSSYVPSPISVPVSSPVPAPTPSSNSPVPAPTTSGGYCYSGSNSVKMVASTSLNTRSTLTTIPISDLRAGDYISAVNHAGETTMTKVLGVPRSRTDQVMIDIQLAPQLNSKYDNEQGKVNQLRVTSFHTFPTCNKDGTKVQAIHLRIGHCLLTKEGEQMIASLSMIKPSVQHEDDFTYSIDVEDSISVISVGGVYTHASHLIHPPLHGEITSNSNNGMKKKGATPGLRSSHPKSSQKSAFNHQKTESEETSMRKPWSFGHIDSWVTHNLAPR